MSFSVIVYDLCAIVGRALDAVCGQRLRLDQIQREVVVATIEDACAERVEIDLGGFEVIPIGVTVTLGKCSRCRIVVWPLERM